MNIFQYVRSWHGDCDPEWRCNGFEDMFAMTRIKTLLLGGSALMIASASVDAQTATPAVDPPAATAATPVTFDPAQLPAFKGQVQLFTMTPRGDIDGIILADGTEVKTPPHLSTEIAFTAKPGDAITIHGLKAASLPLVRAVSVTSDVTGKTVVDEGPGGRRGPEGRNDPPPPPPPGGPLAGGPGAPPPPPPAEGRRMAAEVTDTQGKVRMPLHGPRGEVNGILLEDGTILRLPPHEAARFSSLMQAGQTIVVSGAVRSNAIGRMVEVVAIGPSADRLTPLMRGKGPKGEPGLRGEQPGGTETPPG